MHLAADDNYPIVFSNIACNGIKTKQGSVVVNQAGPHSWILQKDTMSLKDSCDPSAISNLEDNHTYVVWLYHYWF